MQRFGPAELRRWLTRALTPFGGVPLVITGNLTSGQATIASPSQLTGVEIGNKVSGTGIPANTTVIKVDQSANQITMSANATANGNAVVITIVPNLVITCHLFQAVPTPHTDPVVSDFQECNFDGYAPLVLSDWQGVFTNASGQAEDDSENLTWILNANPVTGNNVFGYWLDYPGSQSGPANVMCWELFTAPLPMMVAGNAVQFAVPLAEFGPDSVNLIP